MNGSSMVRASSNWLKWGLLASSLVVASVAWGASRGITAAQEGKVVRSGPARVDLSLTRLYTSWGQLKDDASLVVVGTAISQHADGTRAGLPWTLTTVRVDQALRNVSGEVAQTVDVHQLGTTAASGPVVVDDFPLLTVGNRYLLFLTRNVLEPSNYNLVGAYQGLFKVSGDGSVSSASQDAASTGMVVRGEKLADVIAAIGAQR